MRRCLQGIALCAILFVTACADNEKENDNTSAGSFTAVHNEAEGTIAVFRKGGKTPVVVQNAKPDFRPYLHPLTAPDGNGILTEYSPGHPPIKPVFTGDLHA